MNFLAHLFLSCDDEDLLVGNMIADFIRNKEVQNYSESVQKGIRLHRQIDSYTDNHPIVRLGTKRLQPTHRKYAPVVIDVLYDYLLVKNWSRYSGQELSEFTKYVYEILQRRIGEMPNKLQQRLPGMIAGDWLTAYGTIEGLSFVFSKMDQRARFVANFAEAPKNLLLGYENYNEEFNDFFPDVLQFVNENCGCD
ncbi:MAG: ACP phosphodiesterase [Saprospiraceae bacterium]